MIADNANTRDIAMLLGTPDATMRLLARAKNA